MTMDQFAWTNGQALYYGGLIMALRSIIAYIIVCCVPFLCKIFNETSLLIWFGLLLTTISRLFLLPFGTNMPKMAVPYQQLLQKSDYITNDTMNASIGCPMSQTWCLTTPALSIAQLVLAMATIAAGYAIVTPLLHSLYSKVLQDRPMAKWVSYKSSISAVARLIGPFLGSYVYTIYGIYPLCGTLSAMCFAMFLWFWLLRFVLNRFSYARTNSFLIYLFSFTAQELGLTRLRLSSSP